MTDRFAIERPRVRLPIPLRDDHVLGHEQPGWSPQAVCLAGELTRHRPLLLLHPEPCVSHRFDGGGRPVQFDACRALTAEEV